jgi:hypothetical protein
MFIVDVAISRRGFLALANPLHVSYLAASKLLLLLVHVVLSLYPLPLFRIESVAFFMQLPPSLDHSVLVAWGFELPGPNSATRFSSF